MNVGTQTNVTVPTGIHYSDDTKKLDKKLWGHLCQHDFVVLGKSGLVSVQGLSNPPFPKTKDSTTLTFPG